MEVLYELKAYGTPVPSHNISTCHVMQIGRIHFQERVNGWIKWHHIVPEFPRIIFYKIIL